MICFCLLGRTSFSDVRTQPICSSPSAMKVLICALLLVSFVHSKFLKPSDILMDIGENEESIAKIFEKVSTLNLLLKNFEQPIGIVQLLEGIFDFGNQTFVIFNFSNEEHYIEWIEHCKIFRSDSTMRTLYYERLYQKNHDPSNVKRQLDFFEDFEPDLKAKHDDSIDQQSPLASSSKKLQESFAEGLDRWFTFLESGFILFCSFDVLEVYLGCLLNRAGTFLFIIEKDSYGENYLEDLSSVLAKAWKGTANLKVFVLIFRGLFVFNPFALDEASQSYGMLEKFSDATANREIKDLNAYPMSVEIFESAYSVPKPTKFNGMLDSFFGPDVQVGRFIQQQMNVSSN